jgi:hypothetical protein
MQLVLTAIALGTSAFIYRYANEKHVYILLFPARLYPFTIPFTKEDKEAEWEIGTLFSVVCVAGLWWVIAANTGGQFSCFSIALYVMSLIRMYNPNKMSVRIMMYAMWGLFIISCAFYGWTSICMILLLVKFTLALVCMVVALRPRDDKLKSRQKINVRV